LTVRLERRMRGVLKPTGLRRASCLSYSKTDRIARVIITNVVGALMFLATLAAFAMIGLVVVGLVG